MRLVLLLLLLVVSPWHSLPAQHVRGNAPISDTAAGDSRVDVPLWKEASLVPAPVAAESFQSRLQPRGRFESAMAGAGYGALFGGVTFGLADYLLGPFWNTPDRGISVALTSLFGAVFVGMPVGAVIGALRGG